MNIPSRLLGVGVAVLLGLAVLACSSDDGDSGSSGNGGSGGSGSSNSSADLRLGGGEPLTLDPAQAYDATSARYIVEIFSGLMTIDANLQVVPDLAERYEVSDDGTVYTFFLRRNAKFHDGRPVTAEDFKYSIDRAANMGKLGLSTVADAYLGDIVGVSEVINRCGSQTDCPVDGVKVIDTHTLQITIDSAKPYFLAKLTYPTAFVVQEEQVESNPRNWTRKPQGTGPYKVVRWDLNERILLEANSDFYLGAPQVNRVLYNIAGGGGLTQYEADEVDVAAIGPDDAERVQSTRDPLNAEYTSTPELSISYIGFNTRTAPFDDPKVRQAFAMAIDKEEITRLLFRGLADPADSIMMPQLPGYNSNAKAPGYNPEEARRLLSESKYGSAAGLGQIVLTEVGGGATASFDTQRILEMLKTNLGVDISINQSEAATFYDDLDRGRLQMYVSGWVMDYPDPENIIDLLFYSKSGQNNTLYSNADVDNLVLQARTEQNVTTRLQLYQQAEEIILNEAPWIPLYFGRDNIVVKPYVKNYKAAAMVIPTLRYVTIDK